MVLTGAGMSVESGIPPFRGPEGLWNRFDPEVDGHVDTLREDPERSWRLFRALAGPIAAARPHGGHAALARAEKSGRVLGVATTNVDALHQMAGSRRVIEIHGSVRKFACHSCGQDATEGFAVPNAGVPRCAACEGVVRPLVTLFGELLPNGVWDESMALLEEAEGLVAVGTSMQVQPAASIPTVVRRRGLPVVEIGPEPSALARRGEAIWVGGTAATTLPSLVAPPRSWARAIFGGGGS
jgi:NAD-dependent deacetylase